MAFRALDMEDVRRRVAKLGRAAAEARCPPLPRLVLCALDHLHSDSPCSSARGCDNRVVNCPADVDSRGLATAKRSGRHYRNLDVDSLGGTHAGPREHLAAWAT